MDSNSFRRRVRKVLKSMKLNVCSCHRNQEYNVSVDARPYDRNSREVADLETYKIVDINYETVNRTKACEQVDEVDKNHEDSECVTRGTEISVYNAEFVCHTTKENDAENVGDVIQDVDGEINVSADEKIRSLGHKSVSPSKPASSTYQGAGNATNSSPSSTLLSSPTYRGASHEFDSATPLISFVTSGSRSEAPSIAPPAIPSLANQKRSNTNDLSTSRLESTIQNRYTNDVPPPLHPKPRIALMAERRRNRQSKTASGIDADAEKRRSRSEGPHGRRKIRNSMHETSSVAKEQYKHVSNERYSMFTGQLSDHDNLMQGDPSESESMESDMEQQKWTKNPLMVRKSRKSDRVSKTDKRRSVHNTDQIGKTVSPRERPPNMFQNPKSKDLFLYPGKCEPLPKAFKFQRMEENRKKRIDMAVTSDEECSPQLRISRLRQRAMLSSNLHNEPALREDIQIVPKFADKTQSQHGFLGNSSSIQNDKSTLQRLSQYDDVRYNNCDENFNIDHKNDAFYYNNAKNQAVKHNKLPSVLPEFLPENRLPANRDQHLGIHGNEFNQASKVTMINRTQKNNEIPVNFARNLAQNQSQESVNPKLGRMASESPKLRSFDEVRAKQAPALKKAVEKVKLTQCSLDSSTDSLDDLIESNIQYLESEIESGKLKRQSGNFGKPQNIPDQSHVIREPVRTSVHMSVNDEFRSRLHDPRQQIVNNIPTQRQNLVTKSSPHSQPQQTTYQGQQWSQVRTNEVKSGPLYGSATYSPHMHRKHVATTEDVSKSDTQLNVNTNLGRTDVTVGGENSGNSKIGTVYYAESKPMGSYSIKDRVTGRMVYVEPVERVLNVSASDGDLGNGYRGNENVGQDVSRITESGMFSDVEYDIVVSERIKKWEKKLTPGEIEERKTVLNTIREYESFSDSNQKDSVPDTPVEIRRDLRQLMSPTNNTGVGKLSVNLTRSTSSISDSNIADTSVTYFEPKVVSSETNLHRIFRVVHEPKSHSVSNVGSENMVKPVSSRRRREDVTNYTQSMSSMVASESEAGTMQQSWPPMVVDSDSGVRKSWRMSRYEEEINELKELVSDNLRDIRKRFDSDVSESDSRRASSPVAVNKPKEIVNKPKENVNNTKEKSGTASLTLNIKPATLTNQRSPVTIRRKLSDQMVHNAPPASPGIVPKGNTTMMTLSAPLTPKLERKLPIFKNIPVETKSVVQRIVPEVLKSVNSIHTSSNVSDSKGSSIDTSSTGPDVWSPNMESRKGLVSIERVKPRTLQTIPLSEDPVWREMEGLATFQRQQEMTTKEVNFDEIDELLKIATGSIERSKSLSNQKEPSWMTSDQLTRAVDIMSQSENAVILHSQLPVAQSKPRKLSDSSATTNKYSFIPPVIQPLKLNTGQTKKSSTSALDDVLEDIRATLQKKPLSPKLAKNVVESSESNSSANPSLQSPLTKSVKSFVYIKGDQKASSQPQPPPRKAEVSKTPSSATPGYDNTLPSWQTQTQIPPTLQAHLAEVGYIDPEFTQFPYIINGNYHLDPDLLSQKLQSTGLTVNESSDEQSLASWNKVLSKFSGNQQNTIMENLATSQNSVNGKVSQSEGNVHDLDRSVEELRSLAQDVEYKLSQIKSRIVSADEEKLDSILLALRKFAPHTEQKYFNLKSKQDFETEKVRKRKLEDALTELEKMYQSLDLDDKSLLDRASRREETRHFTSRTESQPQKGPLSSVSMLGGNWAQRSDSMSKSESNIDYSHPRRSHIEEIERQTQNEFEDITKSFQVLLDEVTKQCRSVVKSSSKPSQPENPKPLYSQRPIDEIRQEPPRHQLRLEVPSQRAVQDSYNTAIKELESVALGNIANIGHGQITSQSFNRSRQANNGMSVNLEKANNQFLNQNVNKFEIVTSPSRNLNIQIQSRAVVTSKATSPGSNSYVSMATEFKPSIVTTKTHDFVRGNAEDGSGKNSVTLNIEVNADKNAKGQGRSGRFRKRGNAEHRKSMPNFTRAVETQTVETQTDPPPSVAEMKEKFEEIRKNSLKDLESDSSPDLKSNRLLARKLSSGVAQKLSSAIDSSDEESSRKKRRSKARLSFSAPDIVSLLDCFNETYNELDNAGKGKKKSQDLKNKCSEGAKDCDTAINVNESQSADCCETPISKPPVYPIWKYPGQADFEGTKKSDQKRTLSHSASERSFTKGIAEKNNTVITTSGNDNTVFNSTGINNETAVLSSDVTFRRRTRSAGCEDENEDQRPRSFHELVAVFEHSPQRREKLRLSGLRKCASEESMFIDLILQKVYHSESDVRDLDRHDKVAKTDVRI